MDKRIIKSLIADKQNEIQQVRLMPRKLELETSCNYVFLGLRRAGKSYMLFQHIQSLIASGASIRDFLYVNFEDERIVGMTAAELNDFIVCYEEMYDRKPIVFLDEVQNVDGWEKFARRLADSKYRVYITGSNARMLSREIASTLGGRYLVKEVYPFSFAEYLQYNQITLEPGWEYVQATEIKKFFNAYFHYGGIAELFPVNDKRIWINSLYQKILLGDIIVRNGIRKENAIRLLAKKLAESVMQPLSLQRLKNMLDSLGMSISRETVNDYLGYFKDAYLMFEIANYTDKLPDRETIKKRYFIDNSLLTNLIFNPDSRLLENLVAATLFKKYADRLFYYNRNVEVDFYVPDAAWLIQVSYDISDLEARERELRSLLKTASFLGGQKLQIVTYDQEMTLMEDHFPIEVIPIWRWILEIDSISGSI